MMWSMITHAIQLRAHRAKATVSMKNNLWQCHILTAAWNYLLSLLCYKYVTNPLTNATIHMHKCVRIGLSDDEKIFRWW